MKNLDLTTFPKTDKNQWLKLAEKQLKGANPRHELAWKNDANLELEGYYDQSDLSGLKYLEDYFSTLESHRWKLYERIACHNPTLGNEKAIKALMGGCDGIILENPHSSKLNVLLKEIDHEICDINFVSDMEVEVDHKFTGFHLHPKGNCVSSIESINSIEQLIQILGRFGNEKYVHRIAMADFFLEVATVRALRFLLEKRGQKSVHIHTMVAQHDSNEHQWFLNTTAGLASILGGSHSIDLFTATGDARISRNTGNLIREESGIASYEDQCGGSYYIEVLTDKIIKQVSEKLK